MHKFIKSLFFYLFCFTLCQYLFTQTVNTNKVFSVNSTEYQSCKTLCIIAGKALPYSSGPWTADELMIILTSLDYQILNDEQKAFYDKTFDLINNQGNWEISKGFNNKIGFETNIEAYIHTNTTDFNREKYWYTDFENRKGLIKANWESWITSLFYSYTEVNFENSSSLFDNSTSDILYTDTLTTNMPFIPPCSLSNINGVFPNRAFLSLGLSNWNISFGRDIIRWGNGQTGNILLGGNQLFDNFAKATATFDTFKYTFLTIFYPHDSNTSTNQNDIYEGTKLFLAHRIEGRFIDKKLNLALAESIIYQSYYNTLSTSILNPAAIFHNYYIRGNSNSMFYVEADYTITQNFNIYTQFVSDDIAVPGEPDTTKGQGGNPNALGYMFGINYLIPFKNGYFHTSIEGVYTDSYLYLRERYNSDTKQFGVSYYASFREFCNSKGATYLKQCIGYKYGGDCIVSDFIFGYQSFDNWKITNEFFYMAHGIITSDIQWAFYPEGIYSPVTPSTSCPVGDGLHEGFVEHFFRYSIFGNYEFCKYFSTSARMDLWWILNQNYQQKPFVFDAQFTLGITYKI